MWKTPAALRATPSRGQHQRPGEAGSAVFPDEALRTTARSISMNSVTLRKADSSWRHPLRALRSRFQRWFHDRLPRTDTLTLTQRNVYIVPTRAGAMLALTLLLLLVASINYQLNLGYLLTFLLAGSAVVGMHVCHGNLRGLTLHLSPPSRCTRVRRRRWTSG